MKTKTQVFCGAGKEDKTSSQESLGSFLCCNFFAPESQVLMNKGLQGFVFCARVVKLLLQA